MAQVDVGPEHSTHTSSLADAPSRYANNLPLQLTSFVGRRREVGAIKQRLWTTRLLTLTGPGGCGKTRLALRVAADLLDTFADGVWWIELAPLADPNLIAQTIATTLGLRAEASPSLLETLINYLRAKQILLILDNCEHLIAACAKLVHALLQACPDLYIMATSREGLNIGGEVLYTVPPMATPHPHDVPLVEALTQYEAVRLFIERAASVLPGFALTDRNASAIAQVCYQLDGMPLAIELAAARVKLLQVDQIAARLDDRFHLLTDGNRMALLRHQTLRAAIDWSYDLLDEDERLTLRHLSVFAGGWTLEAAEAVCADRVRDEPTRILDQLTQLVNKSLVSVEREQGKQTRYRMLETIRQYAQEKLNGSDDAAPMRDRHLAYFTALSEQAWYGFLSPDHHLWTRRIATEIDNVRSALNWSLAEGDSELGLSSAIALFHFWIEAGYVAESIAIYQDLLASPEAATPSLIRAKALAFLSLSHLRLGEHEQAMRAAEAALALDKTQRNDEATAYALAGLGHAYALQENYPQALTCLKQSLALFQALHHVPGQGWTLSRLGTMALHMGDPERAEAWLAEQTDLMRSANNTLYLTYALRYWGFALLQRGDVAQALSKFQEELALFKDPEGIYAGTLGALAGVAIAVGKKELAARLLGAVDAQVETYHHTMLPYDLELYKHNITSVTAELDEATFRVAWAEGRALSPEQMIELAQSVKLTSATETVPRRIVSRPIPGGLTKREREVAALVAQGKSNREIAQTLVLSEYTIASHVSNILSKLEFSSRTQIVSWAIEKGLARLPTP
jgi:predicted ATPase/DNA-binding CsgD family transcriptional regulator